MISAASIRIERDPAFWAAVAAHPAVAPHIGAITPEELGAIVASERAIPLASHHGGFLFIVLDGLGRVVELHTLFTPDGWGREVHGAGKAALEHVFGQTPAQLVETLQPADNPRSRPPVSFGFVPCGDLEPSMFGPAVTWALSKSAWNASPARRSMRCP